MLKFNGVHFSTELLHSQIVRFVRIFIGQFQLALTLTFYKDRKLIKPFVQQERKRMCILLTFLSDMQNTRIAPILNVAICIGRNFKYWHLWRMSLLIFFCLGSKQFIPHRTQQQKKRLSFIDPAKESNTELLFVMWS